MTLNQLDQIDLQLISLLEKDGRTSYSDLAKQVGVSIGTARNRLQRMIEEQVIQVAAYPNPNWPNSALRAFMTFSVEVGQLTRAAQHLIGLPQIRYAAITTGSFDIVALAEFSSKDDMLAFFTGALSKVPGMKETQSFVILSVLKSLGMVIHSLDDNSSQAAG